MDDLTLVLKHRGLSSSSASKSTIDLLKNSQSNRLTNSTFSTLLSRNTASNTNLRESLTNLYKFKDNRKPVIYKINDNVSESVRRAYKEVSSLNRKSEELGKASSKNDFNSRLSLLKKQYQVPKKYTKSKSNFEIQFEKEVKDIFEKKNIVKKYGDQTKIIKNINLYYNHLEKSANTSKRFINQPVVKLNKPDLKMDVKSIYTSPIKLHKSHVVNSTGPKITSNREKNEKKLGITDDLEVFNK